MLTSILSILGINWVTSTFKSAIAKYGDTGVHIIVLGCSIVVTGVWALAQVNPTFMTFLQHMGILFAASIATYEVVWKQLDTVITPPSISNL